MTEPSHTDEGKKGAALRIRQLLDERKQDSKRISDLERQLADCAQKTEREQETLKSLHADLEAKDHELAQSRDEREEQQKKMPERIAKAREEGRKLFRDFDAIIGGVAVDREAFQTLLASKNGAELMYACGLGLRMIGLLRELQSQEQSDKQRVEHYRQLHRQHLAGGNSGIVDSAPGS